MAKGTAIGWTVTELAAEDPQRRAITCGDAYLTRQELEERANRRARAYAELGVGRGDIVTIALPNSIEFFEVAVACWKLGAVPQPVSSRLPGVERAAIVDLADPALVVGADEAEHPGRRCLPAVHPIDPHLSAEPHPEIVSPAWKAISSGGSTGRPKLIVAGGGSDVGRQLGAPFLLEPDDCQLVAGPLYHNAPFALSTSGLVMGNHLVVLPRFDPESALDAIGTHGVTWVNFVPTMLLRLLRVIEQDPARWDLGSLRIVWHMAAPCAPWLKEAWIDLVGPDRLYELYGGTEAQAMTVITGREWLDHRGSVGRPLYGEMRVLREDGSPAAPGEEGEVFMRAGEGASPTYRYIGAEVRERDGWESIGDLGWMDDDGYLYLSDRRTDLILAGGANVYPAEVEAAIESHPLVFSCAVVGLSDEDLGQRVHAVVHGRPGLTEADLLEHVSDRLARYKVPRSIEFVGDPVRDDAGKVRRVAVREAAELRRG